MFIWTQFFINHQVNLIDQSFNSKTLFYVSFRYVWKKKIKISRRIRATDYSGKMRLRTRASLEMVREWIDTRADNWRRRGDDLARLQIEME